MTLATHAALGLAQSRAFDRRDWLLMAAVVALGLIVVLIDPVGYIGGHWDDGRYLEAALAWAERGPVLGPDHWSLRWPVVLPAAAAIDIFGRTRAALMLPSLAAFALLLATTYAGTRAVFADRTAAVIAGLSVITVPAIATVATRLTADIPEALFWSWAIWAFVLAARSSGRAQALWLAASGIGCGLVWADRETGLGLALLLAAAFVTGAGAPRVRWGWLVAGAILVVLPEQLLLWQASGSFFYRLVTDLHHIEVPSDHLRGLVAKGAFAPLNGNIASRWDGAGPITVHWTLDSWINLLVNPLYGLNFIALAILALDWRRLPLPTRRALGWLALIIAVNVVTVVYIVATDPKPRMFMPGIVAAAVGLGLLLAPYWQRRRRAAPLALGVAKLAILIVTLNLATQFNDADLLAARVLAAAPGPVEADRYTLSHLALAPAAVHDRLTATPAPLRLFVDKSGHLPERLPGRWEKLATAAPVRPWSVAFFAGLGLGPRKPPVQATLWRCVADCAPLQQPPSVDVGQ